MSVALPWYSWFPAQWLSSETRLSMSALERSVYRDLLDHCYENGSIPDNPAVLATMAAVTVEEFAGAWPKVSQKFPPHPAQPGRLINMRAASEIEKREAKSRSGSAGGRTRAKQPPEAGASPENEAGASQNSEASAGHKKKKKKKNTTSEAEQKNTNIVSQLPRAPAEDGQPLDEFFDQRYRLHQKKGDRGLAEHALAEIPRIKTAAMQAKFAAGHDAWIATDGYRKDGGQYAPKFAQFITDRTWTYDPPEVLAEKQQANRKSDGTDPYGDFTDESN